MLNFQKIDNEEYFYYVITNTLLNNFKDPFINEELYHKSLKNLFRVLQSLKEKMFIFDDKKYSLLFEYTILLILNSEYNSILSQINNTFLYEIFTNSLYNEINSVKSLNDEEIIKEFSKYNKNVEIKNNSIIFCDNSFEPIENYQNYYITHKFIRTFSEENFIGNMLMHYIKYDLLINPKYYFSGYLYNIIETYVSSNLSKSSIYECFDINQGQCPELENEIFTKNIHKYIRYLPYNSFNDTGRTIKQFGLIIIDPSKQKMLVKLNNVLKKTILYKKFEQFVNIVVRKFTFEHEHHHLCNNLLYFLYTNKSDGLNTPPKLVKNNKVLEIKPPFEENKNILKESGNIFEKIVYGKIKKIFTLKQLLFIGNEKNDNLNVHEYRKKFKEISNQNIDDLFKAYDNNNILGELVGDIYTLLKNELGKDFNSILDSLIVSKEEGDGEDIYEDIDDDESIQEELKELKEENKKKNQRILWKDLQKNLLL